MTPLLSRLAALALAAIVLLAAVLGVALPLIQAHQSGQTQISDLREQIAAFRARRGAAPRAQPVEITDPALIVADSEALAAVQIQQRIDPILARTGAEVDSRDTEKPLPEAHWTRIRLRLVLTIPEDRLADLLARLESLPVYLFVDELDLRRMPPERDAAEPPLMIRMRITGLMRPPGS